MKDFVRLRLDKDDRRSYARAVKFVSGCVLLEGQALDCLVIDLSINGARLLFDRPLPDFEQASVRLSLKLRMATPLDLPMRVAWRDGLLLGVQFLDDPADIAVGLENLLPKECLELPEEEEAEPAADPVESH